MALQTDAYRLSYTLTEGAGGVWTLLAHDIAYSTLGSRIALPQSSVSAAEFEKSTIHLVRDGGGAHRLRLMQFSAADFCKNHGGVQTQIKRILGEDATRELLAAEFNRDKGGFEQCSRTVQFAPIDANILQRLAEGAANDVELFAKACATIA